MKSFCGHRQSRYPLVGATKMSQATRSRTSTGRFLLCLSCLLLGQLGCKTLEVRDRWFDSDRVAEIPSEILPIWTDTVLHQPGKAGVRGFGGRVYFYEEGKPDPVKVDGQLAVYAFDGDPKSPEMVAPLRKFVFTPDQLESHHSKSSLGNSYSVWIPWDKVGGTSETLSLVARFDGRAGGTAMSKPSRMLLPGINANQPVADVKTDGLQLASHNEEVVSELETGDTLLNTSSIDLPPSFQRRMLSGISPLPVDEKNTSQAAPFNQESLTMRNPQSPRERAVTAITPELNELTSQTSVENSNSQSEARLSPQRFPARRTPKVRPGPAALRRQPHPGGWPDVLPPTPRSGSNWQSKTDSRARASTRLENERPRLQNQLARRDSKLASEATSVTSD